MKKFKVTYNRTEYIGAIIHDATYYEINDGILTLHSQHRCIASYNKGYWLSIEEINEEV